MARPQRPRQAHPKHQRRQLKLQAVLSGQVMTLLEKTKVSCFTVTSLCSDCFVYQKIVLTSHCLYSKGPLQSECSDWFPLALSLSQECPYIECPYNKKVLYCSSWGNLHYLSNRARAVFNSSATEQQLPAVAEPQCPCKCQMPGLPQLHCICMHLSDKVHKPCWQPKSTQLLLLHICPQCKHGLALVGDQ